METETSIIVDSNFYNRGMRYLLRREGKGINPKSIQDTVKNPQSVKRSENGVTRYQGENATVILNSDGRVITAYPLNSKGFRCGD